MITILSNARTYSSGVAASANNTTNLVVIPAGNQYDPAVNLDSASGNNAADYRSSFQGNVENTTPTTFTTDGQPSRSDLYQLLPDNTATFPPGKYLGYFELRTDGSLVFVAATVAIPAPTLTITTSVNSRMISFPSVAGANYTLFYTDQNGLTTAASSWTTVPTNILGDGTVKAFQDSAVSAVRFYKVAAH